MRFEIYQEPSGAYRWRLRNADGKVLAHGVSSTNRERVRAAVAEVQAAMPSSTIEDAS